MRRKPTDEEVMKFIDFITAEIDDIQDKLDLDPAINSHIRQRYTNLTELDAQNIIDKWRDQL